MEHGKSAVDVRSVGGFGLRDQVAALEGLKMEPENFSRLQLVQANLLRYWGDKP